jgi:hypothetical protein
MMPYRGQTTRTKYLILIFHGLLMILGAVSCNLPTDILQFGEVLPLESTEEVIAQEALVSFHVTVPSNTPSDQPVLISVLDEVTGLALNAQRYTMDSIGDSEYVIGLPFPAGTTVKYRYSRKGEVTAEEHTTDGRAVRYRMFHVEAPGEVNATVDLATGNPIPGMLVTAGGAQAITTSDGSFLLEGLPPGIHTIVALAPDGSYKTFQHGALVAAKSTTPAPLQLIATQKVDVTFIIHVPEDTPPIVPIRLAGNLSQLGNSFADLNGGVSTLASRMPVLSPLPDGTYGLIIGLPAGIDLQYKFTLGDGFWNSERGNNGDWVTRQLVVPDEPMVIENTIENWHTGSAAPITFDITVPGFTPPDDDIYIQFNPYGWTEPIPMWHLGDSRWAYILLSPLDMVDKLGYRYCRSGQCGHADDSRTPGVFTSGQVVSAAEDPQGIPDKIESWAWYEKNAPNNEDLSNLVVEAPRNQGFLAGVETQERFHPSWMVDLTGNIEDIAAIGSNWLVLTPGWTFSRQTPPVLELVTGQNPTWSEMAEIIRLSNLQDLNIALRPIPQFPTQVDQWWLSAPRDFTWWVSWFDRYETFALHFADMAEQNGVKDLILGGEWMSPALPSGVLADGTTSGVPPDADFRYRNLIAKVRERFSGNLSWAINFPADTIDPVGFIQGVDTIYILWSTPLSEGPDPTLEDLKTKADSILSTELYSLYLSWKLDSKDKNLVISMAYPSIQGGTMACLDDPMVDCIDPNSLNYPAPDLPILELDLAVQARVYNAMLGAISRYGWISGVTSRGYYLPTILQDKSTSIHGKPAENVLAAWFEAFQVGE